VGGYYQQRPTNKRDKPPGCLDALAITRAVFAVLVWPLAMMFVAVFGVAITLYLYATDPWLALIPIAFSAMALGLIVRWERGRARSPEDH
jgi:hypothetical protein